MLDASALQQVKSYLDRLVNPITLTFAGDASEASEQIRSLLSDLASVSKLITVADAPADLQVRRPSFTISRTGENMGIRFAALPMGHEFSSLILALLQASGYPSKSAPDLLNRVRGLQGDYDFVVYMSLSCHNCPDVVQALNLMAVPTVFLNGKEFMAGRHELGEIVAKLDEGFVKEQAAKLSAKAPFDVLVVGAGPAGATAAIYAARKGLRTGLLCERPGGQVNETSSIENFTSILSTDGVALGGRFMEHVNHYGVDVMALERAVKVERQDGFWQIELASGGHLQTKAMIAATGARWRQLGVPGEKEYQGKGVAYCPHCDGPLFKGKDVVVVGGGNSGVEAAIDLAAICRSVTLLQRGGQLTADEVLVKKLLATANAKVIFNMTVESLEGNGQLLTGVRYKDKATGEFKILPASGCFVQIGLVPNTDWLKGTVALNDWNEIIINDHGATSAEGIFAGGDCTTSPYKQVVIALGGGATAALGAFDWLIRQQG